MILGCLFGLAVECVTIRLSSKYVDWPNQLDRTGYQHWERN